MNVYENYKLDELRSAVEDATTQSELALKVGMSQAHLSFFLTGKRNISFFTYCKICRAINKEPKEFLTEDAKKLLTSEIN